MTNLDSFFMDSVYFGVALSLVSYFAALGLSKKIKCVLFNPLLIASIFIMLLLHFTGISFTTYQSGAKYLTYFLTPTTVCLAIPMYRRIKILKENVAAILVSILCGALACQVCIVGLGILMHIDDTVLVSLLPKSITTAVAIGVADEMGGLSMITILAVSITGILGSVMASFICRLLHIENPVAVGLAHGNAAHAIGTSRAFEIGEIQGAMSSLAIVVAAVMTVVLAPLADKVYLLLK